MTLPIEQKQLLLGCQSLNEFKEKYILAFGSKTDPMVLPNRIKSLWHNREIHMKEVAEYKAAMDKANHTVMIPAYVRSKATARSLDNDDAMQAKIFNQLLYIGELIKEQNAMIAKTIEANE